jgi:RNA polymerase sigma-70 factor (ECF subfamily)
MAAQQNVAECVAQHLPYLNRIVCGLTRFDQNADDVVQQTALKALIHAGQFRFESSSRTWLSSIAINEVRQLYRSRSRTRAVPLVTEILEADPRHSIELPDDTYEAKERDLLVRHAVSRLPQLYRSVIELCEFEQLPLKEVASKLGLSLAAVKSRRFRARQKLRLIVTMLRLKPAAQSSL